MADYNFGENELETLFFIWLRFAKLQDIHNFNWIFGMVNYVLPSLYTPMNALHTCIDSRQLINLVEFDTNLTTIYWLTW